MFTVELRRDTAAEVISGNTGSSILKRQGCGAVRVAGIEYDPNRSANIALLHYADGEKRYILAPLGLQEGDTLVSRPRQRYVPQCHGTQRVR